MTISEPVELSAVRSVPDRLPLHGGRLQVSVRVHGRPFLHDQPGAFPRQHSQQGQSNAGFPWGKTFYRLPSFLSKSSGLDLNHNGEGEFLDFV